MQAIALITDGDNLRAKGNYSKAISCYTKAIAIDERNWYPYCMRGYCYKISNSYDEAIRDYVPASSTSLLSATVGSHYELNPDDADYLYTLGEICIRVQKYSEAKNCFIKAANQGDFGSQQALKKWERFFNYYYNNF
jgi:tetratricopeptide (TPR) repeat protein